MRYLSLFSGVEAVSVAWGQLGWDCVAVSEIEPFPCAVLAHHYPDVPNLGDVTKVTEAQIKALGHIDIVVFGSPCQDLSVAGKRAGLKGERSGLFTTAMQIIEWSGARFALWENVPGAFSSNKGNDFTTVVSDMAGLNGLTTPKNGWAKEGAAVGDGGLLEWAILDAQWFGVAQRRRRVFALRDAGDWANRPPILLEPQSVRRDTAPIRETRQNATTDARKGFAKQRLGEYIDGGVSSTLAARDYKDATDLITETYRAGGLAEMLKSESAGTLRAARGDLGGGSENLVAFTQNSRDEVRLINGDGRITGALCASSGAKTTDDHHAVAYGVTSKGNGDVFESYELHPTLSTGGGQAGQGYPCSRQGSTVRRLTPIECERLQGFPDGYTDIPYKGKKAPDSGRYKAMGNSMAVPVMLHIGKKIKEAVEYATA